MRQDRRPYYIKKVTAAVNRLYAKHFLYPHFDEVGPDCHFINPRRYDVNGPNIRLASNVHLMSTRDAMVHLTTWSNGERSGCIEIGDYCVILPGVRISSASRVRIGKGCLLASHTYITDADWHDVYDRNSTPGRADPVTLDDNVWIGDSVIICKGVRVGENSVAGAGSVLVDDVPPNVVVAGNPARVVRALDPAKEFRGRDLLFKGEVSYAATTDDYDRQVLEGNSFGTWLRSKLAPTREL